jgi:hypothetical protein
MRRDRAPTTNRELKKRRRRKEPRLKEALKFWLEDDPQNRDDRPLRWALDDLLDFHLRTSPWWAQGRKFVELPDIRSVSFGDAAAFVRIEGSVIWWAEGKDAEGEWWPDDRVPERTRHGGRYMVEPVAVDVLPAWGLKRRPRYRISFGRGTTQRWFTNAAGWFPTARAN